MMHNDAYDFLAHTYSYTSIIAVATVKGLLCGLPLVGQYLPLITFKSRCGVEGNATSWTLHCMHPAPSLLSSPIWYHLNPCIPHSPMAASIMVWHSDNYDYCRL